MSNLGFAEEEITHEHYIVNTSNYIINTHIIHLLKEFAMTSFYYFFIRIIKICRTFALIVFFISYIHFFVYAQITGSVTNEDGEPIPFSTVLLLDPEDSTLIKGTVTDETGNYKIENIESGNYLLEVSSVGYEPLSSEKIAIDNGALLKEDVKLKESVKVLNDLVIAEKKPLFEQKIDRLVVNVQSSITFSGNSALEVLQKSPGIQINRQNNSITLNGKGGVVVMINDKVTRLPIDAVVQMLDGMSATSIEKVELITTPPAKYDAEGTGGIIHIVMKESEDWGTNGSYGINAGYNGNEQLGGNINLFHRTKKWGLLFDYAINYDHSEQLWSNFRSIDNNGFDWVINSESVRDSKTIVQNLRAGIEYAFSEKTRADILFTGYHRNWGMDALTDSRNTVTPDSSLFTNMMIHETNIWKGAVLNVGLDHHFTKDQALSIDFDYISYENHNPSDYRNNTLFERNNSAELSLIDINKTTPLNIKVVSVDYSNQLGKKFKISMGAKGSLSNFKNDVSVADNHQNQWSVVDSLTNIAFLDEDIFASYFSTNWNISEKLTLNAGLRYEFTDTQLDTNEERGVVDRRLKNFFPTVYLQQKIGASSSVQASYSKRITRPTFANMAPFVFLSDPNTFFSGNPALRPAIIHLYKVDYNVKALLFSVQFSNARYSIAPFQPSFNSETNQQILYALNLDKLQTWNFTSGIPFSPYEWWDIQTNLIGTYQKVFPFPESAGLGISSFSINMMNTFRLPSDYSIELVGSYLSKSFFGLWEFAPTGSVDLGFQKKLNNDGGTFRLSFNDMFNTSNWRLSAVNQNDLLRFNFRSQSIKLSFTKSFGNRKLRKVDIKGGSEAEQRRVL